MSKKKCPRCNSTRTANNETGVICYKCGYENRTNYEKEVHIYTSPSTPKKRCELGEVLKLLNGGKTRAEIIKKTGITKSALSNQLRRLENLGKIRRVGKYKIDVLSSSHLHPGVTKNKFTKNFNKRGHAHNFTIHFHKKPKLLELSKIRQDEKVGILKRMKNGCLRFVKDGFTIWINKQNLTIYSNNSYYSKDGLKTKFQALREVDNLTQNLIWKYDFPKSYGIEVWREHYGLIFNKFAKWLNKQGGKMYVKDERGKSILWVDKSRKDDIGLEEFEGKDPLTMNTADDFFDSKLKTGWKDDTPQVEANQKSIEEIKKEIEKGKRDLLMEFKEEFKFNKELSKNQMGISQVLEQMQKDFVKVIKILDTKQDKDKV